jgi:hypothetical protein
MKKRIIEITVCFFAILGLMMAGSDGEWFPIPNIIGLCILGVIASCIAVVEERAEHLESMARRHQIF